jgi:hypothetical protein
LAEEWVGQVVVGLAEIRVVEDVEELGSEAQPQPLGEVKLPLHRKIGLPSSETPQDIAAEIALLTGGVNAAGLNALPPGYCGPYSKSGTPGTTSGRGYTAMPSAKTIPLTTSTGGAFLAKMKLPTDQPPKAAWAILFEGRS